LFGFIVAGLRQRALRSLTAVAVLAVALAVLALTTAGMRRAWAFVAGSPDFIAISSANTWLQLPLAFVGRLAKVPGVDKVEYYDLDYALDGTPDQNPIGTLVMASDGYFDTSEDVLMKVAADVRERWLREKQGLVSNQTTAAQMHWTVGQQVNVSWQSPFSPTQSATPFLFLGTYSGADPDELVVHYDYVNQLLPPKDRDRIFMAAVFRSPEQRERVDHEVDQVLRDLPEATKAGPSAELIAGSISGEMATLSLLQTLTAFMLAMTCAIVGATLAMSLRERRPEIGTLRALGFTRSSIFRILVSESGRGVDLGPSYMSDVHPGLPELLLAAVAAGVLALGISAWPALAAARRDVVTTLQEG
jgi:hypothetical protein